MRISVLIIGLCLSIAVLLQSCAATVAARLSKDQQFFGEASVGIFVAILFLLGAAFALGKPRVSQIVFMLAAVLGFIGGAGKFKDLAVWGGVALALSVMSYFGVRELRNKESRTRTSGGNADGLGDDRRAC